jgi:hypothetical protein
MSTTIVVRVAAVAAAAGFAGLALFELALAAGVPLGRAAWGGADARLSTGLRVGSAVAIVFYLLAVAVVFRRAGLTNRRPSMTVARRGTWGLVVILTLSGLANFLSPSNWERLLMCPTAWVLASPCSTIARGSRATGRAVSNDPARSTDFAER